MAETDTSIIETITKMSNLNADIIIDDNDDVVAVVDSTKIPEIDSTTPVLIRSSSSSSNSVNDDIITAQTTFRTTNTLRDGTSRRPPMSFVSDRPDIHPVRGVDGQLSSLRDYAVTIVNSCETRKCIMENCERIQVSTLFDYDKCMDKVTDMAVERVHKLRSDAIKFKEDLSQAHANLNELTQSLDICTVRANAKIHELNLCRINNTRLSNNLTTCNIYAEQSKADIDDLVSKMSMRQNQFDATLQKITQNASACRVTMHTVAALNKNLEICSKRNVEYQEQLKICNTQGAEYKTELQECLDKHQSSDLPYGMSTEALHAIDNNTNITTAKREAAAIDDVFERLLTNNLNTSRISELTPPRSDTPAVLSDHFKVGGLFVAIILGIKAGYVVCCYTMKRWCCCNRQLGRVCRCGCCDKCLDNVESHEIQPINGSSTSASSPPLQPSSTQLVKPNKKAPYVSMQYSKKHLNASTATLPITNSEIV